MQITTFYHHVEEAMKQTGHTLAEIGKRLNEHGVTGVEMDYGYLKGFSTSLPKKLRAAGIPIVTSYCFFDWGREKPEGVEGCIREGRKALKKLKKYGIKNMLVVPGFLDRECVMDEVMRKEYRNRMITVVKALTEDAEKLGIAVNLEDFDDNTSLFGTADEIAEFFAYVPKLGCAFDTGNFLYHEEDALEVLPRFLGKIRYVHCKDRTFTPESEDMEAKETIEGRKMYACAVGYGEIPMEEIVNQIRRNRYDGVYAIEHFGSKDYLRDMVKSADWLRERLQ